MSNPARAPREPTEKQLALGTAPDAVLPDGFGDLCRKYRALPEAQAVLGRLDMEVMPTFHIPKHLTVDKHALQAGAPVLALAKKGAFAARVRTDHAKRLVNAAFIKLPETGPWARERVAAAMRDRVYMDSGVEGALGRIAAAYPPRGVSPASPVTAAEAARALGECGLLQAHLPPPALRPFPLVARGGEVSVVVNPHSDNGFPVGGQWATPGAAELCMALARTVEQELATATSVEEWVREAEAGRPYLVALKGKAKADYYSLQKVVEAKARFYNALPRQIMLVMQKATQVMEQNSRNILTGGHSGIGITLTHGGAADLVDAMEAQLRHERVAYVHVGDDSWVVLKRGAEVVQFALDCSNFDLTQHAKVTRAVHEAIAAQLRLIEPRSADLWLAYARERMVVTVGTLVRKWKHAGPSGMPLQSKVNDVLMEVLIARVVADLGDDDPTAERVARAVETQGRLMGFTVKLEQYWRGIAEGLLDALQQHPFLFIGYYFHVRGGEVRVCCDVPRTFAQVPYPAQKWEKSSQALAVKEAMRLGSITLNLGMPPAELEPAFAAFRGEAMELIRGVIRLFGDSSDPKLRWAVQESPYGAATEPSLSGLLRALERDAGELWLQKELPLPSSSRLVLPSGGTWADEVEQEEREEAALAGLSYARPLEDRSIRPMRLAPSRVPTHPPTSLNDGRPPPTAVWGPDRPPRPPRELWAGATARSRRRDGIAFREFHEALQEEWDMESDSEEELL